MIWVDPPWVEKYDRLWSHLISDTSLDELHAFAAQLGIPERGFGGDHYDIPESLYEQVLALGARSARPRDLAAKLRAAGLRRSGRPAHH